MTDIASHIRIFEASPTDDFVEKRQTAVAAIADSLRKRASFSDLIGLADGLAAALTPKGKLPDQLAAQVQTALKDASPSFILEGHELEAKVCGVLGGLTYLSSATPGNGAATRSDVLALSLWSALSFQKPLTDVKMEKLRTELTCTARNLAAKAAENSRQRSAVPDGAFAPPEAEGWAGIEKKWKTGPLKAIDSLRLNAALDREEIDILWWVVSDWSDIYQKKFSSMDSRLAPIAASWELAQLLKRIPAEAHKHLILRLVANTEKESLTDLIAALNDRRANLAQQYAGNTIVSDHPHVFPLLNAIAGNGFKVSGEKEPRISADWAARALVEAGLLRVTKLSAPIS